MRARGLPITFPTGSPAEKDNDPGQERSLPCSFPTLSYPSLSFLNSFRVEIPVLSIQFLKLKSDSHGMNMT